MSFVVLVVISLLGWGTWQSTGPEGGDINAPVQSPTNASELWALSGTNPTQVVHSTDAGLNWEAVSSFTNGTPYDMIVTSDGNLVVVGSSRSWSSIDGGQSWVSNYHSNTNFYDAVAHPTAAGELFAAGYKYDGTWKMSFMHSTDNGATFSVTYMPVSGTYGYGRCIDVSRSDPSVLLVGGYAYTTDATYDPVVFLSTDGGTSFTDVTPAEASSEYYFYGVAIHPSSPDIMLSGSLYGVYRSINGGSSWNRIRSQTYNYRMAFSQADDNLLFAGGSTIGYRSTDGGNSWTNLNSGLSGSDIQWIIPSWNNSSDVFTGSSDGFFRSSNSGASWISSNSGLTVGKVLAMAESQGWLFMNMEDMGLFKAQTNTDGIVWEEVSTPLTCGDFCDICADGAGTLLALEGSG